MQLRLYIATCTALATMLANAPCSAPVNTRATASCTCTYGYAYSCKLQQQLQHARRVQLRLQLSTATLVVVNCNLQPQIQLVVVLQNTTCIAPTVTLAIYHCNLLQQHCCNFKLQLELHLQPRMQLELEPRLQIRLPLQITLRLPPNLKLHLTPRLRRCGRVSMVVHEDHYQHAWFSRRRQRRFLLPHRMRLCRRLRMRLCRRQPHHLQPRRRRRRQGGEASTSETATPRSGRSATWVAGTICPIARPPDCSAARPLRPPGRSDRPFGHVGSRTRAEGISYVYFAKC